MSDPASLPIHLVHSGEYAEITIDAPARRNALNLSMWSALPVLIRTVDADSAAKALIIHGGDVGHFAAGVDISEFSEIYATEETSRQTTQIISEALSAVERCSKPVIAAIDGSCFGAGISLALACDIRIASQSARFGLPPAKLGIVYPPDDLKRLLATIGPAAAKRMLFTARQFSAGEALDLGLIDELADADTALGQTKALVSEISANSTWSVRAIKAMTRDIQSGVADEQLMAWMVEGATGPDFREGYGAFLEKRKPDFPSG
jgi:enoyl-CoA hydratase/carnithine racemase